MTDDLARRGGVCSCGWTLPRHLGVRFHPPVVREPGISVQVHVVVRCPECDQRHPFSFELPFLVNDPAGGTVDTPN